MSSQAACASKSSSREDTRMAREGAEAIRLHEFCPPRINLVATAMLPLGWRQVQLAANLLRIDIGSTKADRDGRLLLRTHRAHRGCQLHALGGGGGGAGGTYKRLASSLAFEVSRAHVDAAERVGEVVRLSLARRVRRTIAGAAVTARPELLVDYCVRHADGDTAWKHRTYAPLPAACDDALVALPRIFTRRVDPVDWVVPGVDVDVRLSASIRSESFCVHRRICGS